jgi:phage terminase small subunit
MDIGKPTFQRVRASAQAAGYSESYAKHQAYRLLSNVGVQKEIERIREQRRRKDVISPEELLTLLSQVARANPKDLVDETGTVRAMSNLDDQVVKSLIAGFKQKTRLIQSGDDGVITEHTLEYKLIDKLKAMDMLAKHHGLYEEDLRPKLVKENRTLLVGYPTEPMPLAEWERQVKELYASRAKALPAPA